MVLLSRHCCSRAGAADGLGAAGAAGAVRTWSLSRSARSALTPRFRTRGSKPSPAAAASSTRHASRAGCGASGNAPCAVLNYKLFGVFTFVCPLKLLYVVVTRSSLHPKLHGEERAKRSANRSRSVGTRSNLRSKAVGSGLCSKVRLYLSSPFAAGSSRAGRARRRAD